MAWIPSSKVRLEFGFCCSIFSTNEGLKDGAEGFVVPDCCGKMLIRIEGLELFSILTDSSLLDCFLIISAMQVISIIAASAVPDPIMGHFIVSNTEVGSCRIMGVS